MQQILFNLVVFFRQQMSVAAVAIGMAKDKQRRIAESLDSKIVCLLLVSVSGLRRF